MATSTLLPTADYASVAIASYSSGTTAYNLLTDNEATNKISFFTNDGSVEVTIQTMGAAAAINSVQVYCQDNSSGGGADTYSASTVYLRIGGVNYSASTGATASTRTYSNTWTTNPATGAAWTTVSINSIQAIGFSCSTYITADCSPTYLVLNVDYAPITDSTNISRHIGSIELWLNKRPEVYGTLTGNLDLLNVGIMQAVDLEHTAGPHPTDAGWEDEPWERRPFIIHGLDLDLNTMTTRLKLRDMRPVRCLVRDLAWSDKASGSIGDGIARFSTPGSTWTFTRAMEETFTNPVGESETVPADVPGYADGGLQILAGASVSRYYVTNNTGERTWSAAQGTFQCEVKFLGTLAQDRTIAYVYHDADNYAHLYYDNASTKIKFLHRANGSSTTITSTTTPGTSAFHQIGVNWTGTSHENDFVDTTAALYFDRVLEATGEINVMEEVASSNLDFGSAAGSTQLRGIIRKIHSFQYVFTHTEMMRPI
jgi:hypothetical protein